MQNNSKKQLNSCTEDELLKILAELRQENECLDLKLVESDQQVS